MILLNFYIMRIINANQYRNTSYFTVKSHFYMRFSCAKIVEKNEKKQHMIFYGKNAEIHHIIVQNTFFTSDFTVL